MIDWWSWTQIWFATSAGLLLVLLGLVGRRPSGFSISLLALAEGGLLAQLVLSLGLVIAGQSAKLDTLEFFGYLLVALMVPVGAGLWALAERNKWSTVVMGAGLLTVAVMLVRMIQIWTGVNPVS
jgi:hypothetical protein